MRKIIGICFAIALVISFSMPAFAADALSVIEITQLTEPKAGSCPTFRANLTQNDEATIANQTWMDLSIDDYMSGTDLFEYGGSYRLEITVMITADRTVWSGNITATINGKHAECYKVDDVYAVVSMDYDIAELGAHTCKGGYATCMDPAYCELCGKPYGKANPDNHDVYASPKSNGDPKKETHHDVKCELCRKVIGEEQHDLGPLNHNNERPCIICWYVPKATEQGEHTHTGGTATCSKGPICEICGKEYGSADQSAHELISVKKAENDPKYATHHDLKCEVCEKIIKEAEHDLGPENHLGLKPCIDCWYTPDPNVGPHECTGGKATCCEKATCSICGEEYGETDKNAHTYLDSWGYCDDEGHAKNCIACGERAATEAHEVSEDNPTQCSICGYYVKEQSFGEKMLKAAPIVAAAAGGTVTTGGASVGVFFLIRKLFFLK